MHIGDPSHICINYFRRQGLKFGKDYDHVRSGFRFIDIGIFN